MTKQKILILTSTYPRWKGDSTPSFVQKFAEGLAEQSEVQVLAPHYQGASTYEQTNRVTVRRFRYLWPQRWQNITYNGGGVYKIKKSPIYGFKLICFIAALFISTLWLSLRYRVDIINPHWAVPQGFVAVLVKFLTGKKVVLTVHGSDIFGLTGRVMTAVKRFTLKHCDEVCVNSQATGRACQAIYQRDYQVIPMGVDTRVFKPAKPSQELSRRYGLGDFTILFVGRLAEVKGVRYLVQALHKLHMGGYDFRAIIAGDGPLKDDLMQRVVEAGIEEQVLFPGWISQEELHDFYSVADVFVGPSLSEAQGIVFIESLATGTPVIASNVGGVSDMVKDGVNGYLVEAKSSQALHDKLKYMINNPDVTQQLAQQARHSIERKYSWTSVIKQYRAVLEKER